MAGYGPKMAWKLPLSTCTKVPLVGGYYKLVPGDAWHHAKGFRANWSAILEKTFKMWPKIVKIGPFLTYFFLDNPPSLIFFPVVCYSIFGLFLYIKINFIHQNWAKPQYFPPKWPHMAQNGLKMAIVNLHQSATCGYSKLVPGDIVFPQFWCMKLILIYKKSPKIL